VIIKTLDELRQADDRTLRFTPMGLGLDVRMRPNNAAEYWQQVMTQLELAPEVAEGTRRSFDDLRMAFPYGVLCYELFTLVHDRALLVLEQALRDRFIAHHRDRMTFVDSDRSQHVVSIASPHQLHDVVRTNRRRELLLGNGQTMRFNGMLTDLLTWARGAGLLHGQRNRVIERALADLRNLAAHPSGYHLTGPAEATRTLSDLAEIINRLWGVATPGGRLYPAALPRHVLVVAWDSNNTQAVTGPAEDLPTEQDAGAQPWRCIIVRAAVHPNRHHPDPGLHAFNARYEATQYPADLLWGPGVLGDAATWYAANKPQPDECDYLDRTFLLRYDTPDLYLPMRPSAAAALPEPDRPGRWYTVKADHPNHAYHHVRSLLTGAQCAPSGPCPRCHAESVHMGSYQQAVVRLGDASACPPPLSPDVAAPWAQPRSHRIAA
jgi:hypothetical protein